MISRGIVIVKKSVYVGTLIIFCLIMISINIIYGSLKAQDVSVDLGIWKVLNGKTDSNIRFHFIVSKNVFLYIGLCLVCLGLRIYKRNTKKMIEKLRIVLSYLIYLFLMFFCVFNCYRYGKEINDIYIEEKDIILIREKIISERYIIHAGGRVYNYMDKSYYSYTNSKEAMNNCYNEGHRLVEFDLMLSSDRRWICAHNSQQGGILGFDENSIPTEREFLNNKIFGCFSTMNIDDLAMFMRDHVDLYVIVDVKNYFYIACQYLAETYPDLLDRFIIQIFHIEDYSSIRGLGFKYIIYTLYNTRIEERTEEALDCAIDNYNLVGITFYNYYADDNDFLGFMLKKDIPLLV